MYIFDTFHNFLSGLGVAGRDKLTGSQYVTATWTREQLETSFRSDWIARKAISIPAHDATREWRAWQAKQPQIEKLEETEKRLQVQLKLQQALTKARLYGGCCLLIGVEGNTEKELDPDTIKKDGLKFLHVLAPHQVTVEELIKDIEDPYFGQPVRYVLRDETEKFGDVKIHPSRMVRLIGSDPPDPMQNSGWGDPLLQMIHDAVNAAGTVAGSIATLIAEAKLDVIKIPGLTEIFSTTNGTNRMIKRFTEANVAKSVINGIIMDAEEEWQRIGVNFAGMPEVLQMYLQIAAGAADIPVTRFVGMSPAGLNATGESDLQNYYDRIHSDQELRLTPALEKLDKAIVRSALGKADEDIFYEWNSLWQMDEAQKSEIDKRKAEQAVIDVNSGLIPPEALSKGRINQLIEDGTYPGLEAAVAEALAAQEMLAEEEEQKLLAAPDRMSWMNENPGGPGDDEGMGSGPPGAQKPKTGVARDSGNPFPWDDEAWNEALHPRGEDGKWVSSGSSETGESDKPRGSSGTGARDKPRVTDKQEQKYYEALDDAPTTEGIEAAEENWRGGVADFGDPQAAIDVQAMEGYFDYRSHLEEAARENLGEEFPVYRLMRREQLEDWKNGADIDPVGTTLNPEFAEKFQNFAGFDKTKSQDNVLVRIPATPASIVMRGSREESEIVINPNEISADRVEIVEPKPASGEPDPDAMTPVEIARHRELEERWNELDVAELTEYTRLNEKFDKEWDKKTKAQAAKRVDEEKQWHKAGIKTYAGSIAKRLGFDESRIDVVEGTREFMVNGVKHTAAGDADIYNSVTPLPGEGRIRLYIDHPNVHLGTVGGITAHEVEHFKFQHALDTYRKEYDAMMKDPGPAGDPNHQYGWGRAGGSSAMMKPDGTLRPPYDEKYPTYTAMQAALYQHPIDEFAKGDGVSKYSAEYWKGTYAGTVSYDIALHETLAEMAKMHLVNGKLPEHWGFSPIIRERTETRPVPEGEDYVPKPKGKAQGTKLWRDLYRTVEKLYKARA